MQLVTYSDSESDGETTGATLPVQSTRPAFQTTSARKIRIELPDKPVADSTSSAGPPPAKRARTAGAFGGFNSLLPAPKRTTPVATGLGRGVSLKTSSEAAFSRRPPAPSVEDDVNMEEDAEDRRNSGDETSNTVVQSRGVKVEPEVKIIGTATRFKPLSVANRKKPKKPPILPKDVSNDVARSESLEAPVTSSSREHLPAVAPTKSTRKSLFSVEVADSRPNKDLQHGHYEPLLENSSSSHEPQSVPDDHVAEVIQSPQANGNSLEAIAADLNLTAAQRRQLFGRDGKHAMGDISVTHFNLNSEYASNEQLRQSGQTVEHRAVKAIAPGKHSLQQLVNNARNNQESMEDKWAEGRRNRGEGGSKYGWSK